MRRKTVEKPGRRQPVQFGVLIFLWLTPSLIGWAQDEPPHQEGVPAAGAPQLVHPAGYRLHLGDKIEIRFFYQPELDQETVIKPDGRISLQLIGEVNAVGLTTGELEERLTRLYADVLVDPVISVILKEYVKPRVFISGEVNKPGPYELRQGETLAQALALAGGFTPRAHRKMVIHARPMGEGQLRVTVIDATKLFGRHPHPELNLALRDGDLIYVPESKLSRLSKILTALRIQTFGLFTDPFRR